MLSGTIQNIHNDVVQKTELLDKTDYLKKVINRSINGLYLYDFDNFINTYVNDEYTHITGYTLDDLLDIAKSDKFLELFHPEDLDAVLEHMSDVQTLKRGVFHCNIDLKTKTAVGFGVYLAILYSVFMKTAAPKKCWEPLLISQQ